MDYVAFFDRMLTAAELTHLHRHVVYARQARSAASLDPDLHQEFVAAGAPLSKYFSRAVRSSAANHALSLNYSTPPALGASETD